jgi:Fe2+ or Zn2+ uptake regulation protein
MAVIDALIKNRSLHPSAALLHREARKKIPRLSLSNVYAILRGLSLHGIVKELQFDKMENRYEGNLDAHVNLICDGRRKIADYQVPDKIDADEIEGQTGFSISGTRLEY